MLNRLQYIAGWLCPIYHHLHFTLLVRLDFICTNVKLLGSCFKTRRLCACVKPTPLPSFKQNPSQNKTAKEQITPPKKSKPVKAHPTRGTLSTLSAIQKRLLRNCFTAVTAIEAESEDFKYMHHNRLHNISFMTYFTFSSKCFSTFLHSTRSLLIST